MERRIPALDGLRGVAISMVLLRHLYGVIACWAGVDIFFVLSGYLITTILCAERHEPHLWRIFYVRRITRIVPAYLALMLGTVLLVHVPWHLLWPYYTFFAANLANVTFTDQQMGPLTAIWSLSVEEHFYFLWPTIVRFLNDKVLLWLLVVLAIAEPTGRVLYLHVNPDWRIYYFLTPFRVDGLILGALLSVALSFPRIQEFLTRASAALFLASAIACVAVFGFFHLTRDGNPWMYNAIGYLLIAVTSTFALSWLVLERQSFFSKALSTAPLVFLGRISYGLYLYHPLVRDVVQNIAHHYGQAHAYRNNLVTLPIAILVAWFSFRFLESPILAYGKRLVGEYRSAGGRIHTTA